VTMGYSEEDLLPISGLQHMVYCERQAALIHVDRVWADNAFTVEGTHLHRVVDEGRSDVRHGRRTLRGINLRSFRLGLIGKADVVECYPATDSGVVIPGLGSARWAMRPVEYKRGRPKQHRADEVQLCAQALCLEELFGTTVSDGALFYGTDRRRADVQFDSELRRLTADVAQSFHHLIDAGVIPVRQRDTRCERCSLEPICMPSRRGQPKSAVKYLREWAAVEVSGDETT
jgi:CRISPR-associated exonuclease Cas4